MTDSPVTIDSLLAHAGWLRELSRRLVGEAAAEDLVQDVWVQASAKLPREGSSPRAWLATVLRRSHGRRMARELAAKAREADVSRPEAQPSAAELVEAAEAQHWLVEAVLGLDEPWREAVLLHFFEGMSAADIARRDGVPASTVRTRIARGVELLRERLDARPGGRESWLSGVALLGFPPRGAAAGGLAASAAVPLSVFVMWKAVAVLASLGLVAWVAVAMFGEDSATHAGGEEALVEEPVAEVIETPDPEPELLAEAPEPERQEVEEPAAPAEPEEVAAAPARPENALVGRVLDPWGEPVVGAVVRNGTYKEVAGRVGRRPNNYYLSAVTDEEGRFVFELNDKIRKRKSVLKMSAKSPEFAASEIVEVGIEDLEAAPELELQLREGARVTGTVYGLDEERVEGRTVHLTSPDLGDMCEVVTDEQGRFSMDGLIPGAWRAATFPEDDELEAAGKPTGGLSSMGFLAQLEFTLEARDEFDMELGRVAPDSPRISGTVTSTSGKIFELFQWYRPRHSNETQTCLIDDEGNYEIALPHPGRWVAFVNTFDGSSRGQRWVFDFEAGEEREIHLVMDGARVSGRVVDGAGEALENVRVELRCVDRAPHRPTATIGGGWETTDAEGRYAFDLVPPGQWGVVVHGTAPSSKNAEIAADAGPIFDVDNEDVELDDIVGADGARVTVRVVDAEGQPVAGASVWFHDDEGRSLNPLTDSRTRSDGSVISPLLPLGRVSVSASMRTGAAVPQIAQVGIDDELELELSRGLYVDVYCDDALDPILAHWRLTDAAGRRWMGLYDRSRTFDSLPVRDDPERPLLGPLAPGSYTLEVGDASASFELHYESPELTVVRLE